MVPEMPARVTACGGIFTHSCFWAVPLPRDVPPTRCPSHRVGVPRRMWRATPTLFPVWRDSPSLCKTRGPTWWLPGLSVRAGVHRGSHLPRAAVRQRRWLLCTARSCARLSEVYGAIAQLVEHLPGRQGVRGSSPLGSTVRKAQVRGGFGVTPGPPLLRRGGVLLPTGLHPAR